MSHFEIYSVRKLPDGNDLITKGLPKVQDYISAAQEYESRTIGRKNTANCVNLLASAFSFGTLFVLTQDIGIALGYGGVVPFVANIIQQRNILEMNKVDFDANIKSVFMNDPEILNLSHMKGCNITPKQNSLYISEPDR